jgi:NAD(P)H-hydrate epimerase
MKIGVGESASLDQVQSPQLIVDGLIGYRLKGAPQGTVADLIRWANAQAAPILALDIPSGVDGTTGTVLDPAIKATATMTLALPKAGLFAPEAQTWVGELYLADIGVPPTLYAEPDLSLYVGALFAESEILRLNPPHNERR